MSHYPSVEAISVPTIALLIQIPTLGTGPGGLARGFRNGQYAFCSENGRMYMLQTSSAAVTGTGVVQTADDSTRRWIAVGADSTTLPLLALGTQDRLRANLAAILGADMADAFVDYTDYMGLTAVNTATPSNNTANPGGRQQWVIAPTKGYTYHFYGTDNGSDATRVSLISNRIWQGWSLCARVNLSSDDLSDSVEIALAGWVDPPQSNWIIAGDAGGPSYMYFGVHPSIPGFYVVKCYNAGLGAPQVLFSTGIAIDVGYDQEIQMLNDGLGTLLFYERGPGAISWGTAVSTRSVADLLVQYNPPGSPFWASRNDGGTNGTLVEDWVYFATTR